MGEMLRGKINNQKERVIQELLKMEYFKATDDRQLYELTLSELEKEYKTLTGIRHRI